MIIGRRFDYEEWIVFETIPEDNFISAHMYLAKFLEIILDLSVQDYNNDIQNHLNLSPGCCFLHHRRFRVALCPEMRVKS